VWAASGRRGDVQAKLKDASLSLVDAGGRELLHALVEGTSLVETCMGSTWRTTFALDSFELTDRFTRPGATGASGRRALVSFGPRAGPAAQD
jgi:hypothetical protein